MINVQCVALCKANSPLSGCSRKPGKSNVRDRTGSVQAHENVTQLFHMLVNHAAQMVVLVKVFQSFVTDRADHLNRNSQRNGCQAWLKGPF